MQISLIHRKFIQQCSLCIFQLLQVHVFPDILDANHVLHEHNQQGNISLIIWRKRNCLAKTRLAGPVLPPAHVCGSPDDLLIALNIIEQDGSPRRLYLSRSFCTSQWMPPVTIILFQLKAPSQIMGLIS